MVKGTLAPFVNQCVSFAIANLINSENSRHHRDGNIYPSQQNITIFVIFSLFYEHRVYG